MYFVYRNHFCHLLVWFSRFNEEVKHIKVTEKDNWIHITEAKKFESLLVRRQLWAAATKSWNGCFQADTWCCMLQQELVEYYQSHSLKESFKLLDTTLRYPYKTRERLLSRTSPRSPGKRLWWLLSSVSAKNTSWYSWHQTMRHILCRWPL